VLGAPALAQTTVTALNPDVFRALQYVKAKSAWGETEARLLRSAITKDGKIDPAEAAMLDALRKGTFEFTVNGVHTATFKPKDMPLKGTLDAAGIALLAISDADLNASVNQRPDESRAAFLYRRGAERVVEFAALVKSDPAARAEGRTIIAKRWEEAFLAEVRRVTSFDAGRAARQRAVTDETGKRADLTAGDQADWAAFLQEVAVFYAKTYNQPIQDFQMLFGNAPAESQATEIAKRIGL